MKQSKGVGETAKVSIRNARRDAIDEFKKMVKSGLPEDEAKDAEDEVQKITDSYNKKIDEILTAKEKDIRLAELRSGLVSDLRFFRSVHLRC